MDATAQDKVIILDRDGTMVLDRDYLSDPDGLEFVVGAADGLRDLFGRGYRLVVITNQSGIGRGYFTLDRMEAMNRRLMEMVRAAGAELEGIYFCPHAPHTGCDCRKPEPGLLKRAALDLDFDPAAAIFIGDKPSDVEFGRRVGAITILIAPGAPAERAQPQADFVVPDFSAAVCAVLAVNCKLGSRS